MLIAVLLAFIEHGINAREAREILSSVFSVSTVAIHRSYIRNIDLILKTR